MKNLLIENLKEEMYKWHTYEFSCVWNLIKCIEKIIQFRILFCKKKNENSLFNTMIRIKKKAVRLENEYNPRWILVIFHYESRYRDV